MYNFRTNIYQVKFMKYIHKVFTKFILSFKDINVLFFLFYAIAMFSSLHNNTQVNLYFNLYI